MMHFRITELWEILRSCKGPSELVFEASGLQDPLFFEQGEEEGEEAPGRSPPPFLGEYSITRQITEG